jgi:hypothetical protein
VLDGKQLREYFEDFNRLYFNNRLPRYSIRVVPKIKIRLDKSGLCDRKRRRIEIKWGQPDEEAIGALLHEMVHAATVHDHSMEFRRQMIRLHEAGAPLAPAEIPEHLKR